nr:MAG TPA: hypothetical protein [Caudoviricetes sp.]
MGKPSLKIKLKSPTWQSNSNGFEHCLENSWSSKCLGLDTSLCRQVK